MAKPGPKVGQKQKRNGPNKTRTYFYLKPETEKGLRNLAMRESRAYSAQADLMFQDYLDRNDEGWREAAGG